MPVLPNCCLLWILLAVQGINKLSFRQLLLLHHAMSNLLLFTKYEHLETSLHYWPVRQFIYLLCTLATSRVRVHRGRFCVPSAVSWKHTWCVVPMRGAAARVELCAVGRAGVGLRLATGASRLAPGRRTEAWPVPGHTGSTAGGRRRLIRAVPYCCITCNLNEA